MGNMPAQRAGQRRIRKVVRFGTAPANPAVSVVVPLFRGLRLFEAQLACLSGDRYLSSCEFVFVVDSPEMSADFERLAFELHKIYEFPMKLVVLENNRGFGCANNLGAEHATGDHLLFLNSDVFPIQDGWLGQMKEFYQARKNIGPLGAKLLYEDDSLQHAGMYFSKEFYPGKLWQTRHYFKGLPPGYAAANVTRRVPAVTGACLMIRRDHFEALEGWDESYFLNFEDSDLSIRAHQRGLDSWYLASTELYHLESQSQAQVERATGDLYACWLQTKRWDSEIHEIMARFPAASGQQAAKHPE